MRKITIEIDAGKTTCDRCEWNDRYGVDKQYCILFDCDPTDENDIGYKLKCDKHDIPQRHKSCLSAERIANEN